jgi:hypothetical protein
MKSLFMDQHKTEACFSPGVGSQTISNVDHKNLWEKLLFIEWIIQRDPRMYLNPLFMD